VGLGDRTHNTEAEAEAEAEAGAGGRVRPEPGAGTVGKSRPVIGDPDPHRSVHDLCSHSDNAIGRAVSQCVVEQVVQRLAHPHRIEVDRYLGGLHDDAHPAATAAELHR
jgi:hypothetical protein